MAEPQGAAASLSLLARDTLLARGPDRKSWLDGLLTCGVASVVPGVAAYGLLLTKQGKIVSDVFLAESGQELLLGVAPGLGGEVQQLLDRYLVMEDAELAMPSSPVFWHLGAGLSAPSLEATDLASGQLKLAGLALNLHVRSTSDAANDGAAMAALFAEHGLGFFGVDFGSGDNPHEASLDRVAVSWTKGCYLGQEVVCMQDMRGKVKRRLVPLAAAPALLEAPLGAGRDAPTVLGADGAVVGHVTSVHRSASGDARLLASIFSSALEVSGQLLVLGQPVRVVEGLGAKLS